MIGEDLRRRGAGPVSRGFKQKLRLCVERLYREAIQAQLGQDPAELQDQGGVFGVLRGDGDGCSN
jgi:hypothetical protein